MNPTGSQWWIGSDHPRTIDHRRGDRIEGSIGTGIVADAGHDADIDP